MIACGWCGQPTEPGPACSSCGRDPALPYLQRGLEPPGPDLHARERRLLADATADLTERGIKPTAQALADRIGQSERTIRRWQQMTV